MRPTVLVATALLASLAFAAPMASALVIDDVDVYDRDSREPLTRVPVGQAVLFIVVVENDDTETFSGTVTLEFDITAAGGSYSRTDTVTKTVTIEAGDTAQIEHTWTATETGNHTADVTLADPAGGVFTLTYIVAESQVTRGGLLTRVIEYAWVYGAFLGVFVLFVAVVRIRKPGP